MCSDINRTSCFLHYVIIRRVEAVLDRPDGVSESTCRCLGELLYLVTRNCEEMQIFSGNMLNPNPQRSSVGGSRSNRSLLTETTVWMKSTISAVWGSCRGWLIYRWMHKLNENRRNWLISAWLLSLLWAVLKYKTAFGSKLWDRRRSLKLAPDRRRNPRM